MSIKKENPPKPMTPIAPLLLVTGATGLVGSHVAEWARGCGWRTRALVRPETDISLLESWGVETIPGELTQPNRLAAAAEGVTHVVHAAARVGDWGPYEEYHRVNVRGLEYLLTALRSVGRLERFVHISSLGVYEPGHHRGTDESVPRAKHPLDGYTRSKVAAEEWLELQHELPWVILRPGFLYGPRDRTVIPNLRGRLGKGVVRFIGGGGQLLNNTGVENLVQAVRLALEIAGAVHQIYNITDGELVTKRQFVTRIAELSGLPVPKRSVPVWLARGFSEISEFLYRVCGSTRAPLLSRAGFKFMANHLEYSIEKARRELGYSPQISFEEGITKACLT